MLTFDIEEFMLELKDGAFKSVGPSNKQATVKMYDIERADVHEYGDKRVKITVEDAQGSEIEIALFPEQADTVAEGLAAVSEEHDSNE
jgi:hypothetical protein